MCTEIAELGCHWETMQYNVFCYPKSSLFDIWFLENVLFSLLKEINKIQTQQDNAKI